MIRRPPSSTLTYTPFPYTTLFRSHASSGRCTAPAPMTVLDGPPSSTVAWESTPKAPVRMFIADDQPLAVTGIRSICATAKPLVEVVATTDSTSGLLAAPNLSAFDFLVLDPHIAYRDGSGTRQIGSAAGGERVW